LPATAESEDLAIPGPTLANPLADLQIDEDTSDVFSSYFTQPQTEVLSTAMQ